MRKPQLDTDRLKKLREAKGWSKKYTSDEMQLDQAAYLRYESGECAPSFSVIKNMALTLGTSVDYLTGKSDDVKPQEILISTNDSRLKYIVELYSSSEEDYKERLYKYAQKIGSQIK